MASLLTELMSSHSIVPLVAGVQAQLLQWKCNSDDPLHIGTHLRLGGARKGNRVIESGHPEMS